MPIVHFIPVYIEKVSKNISKLGDQKRNNEESEEDDLDLLLKGDGGDLSEIIEIKK